MSSASVYLKACQVDQGNSVHLADSIQDRLEYKLLDVVRTAPPVYHDAVVALLDPKIVDPAASSLHYSPPENDAESARSGSCLLAHAWNFLLHSKERPQLSSDHPWPPLTEPYARALAAVKRTQGKRGAFVALESRKVDFSRQFLPLLHRSFTVSYKFFTLH